MNYNVYLRAGQQVSSIQDHIITSSISQSHSPVCHLPGDAESYREAAALLRLCSGFPEMQRLNRKKKAGTN